MNLTHMDMMLDVQRVLIPVTLYNLFRCGYTAYHYEFYVDSDDTLNLRIFDYGENTSSYGPIELIKTTDSGKIYHAHHRTYFLHIEEGQDEDPTPRLLIRNL